MPAQRPCLPLAVNRHRSNIVSTVVLAVLAHGAMAQSTSFEEQYKQIRAPHAVAKIGSDLFGDSVNLSNGGLTFVQTDVSLRGNFALPVSIGRRFVAGGSAGKADRPFGRWNLDIAHLHGVFSYRDGWSAPVGLTGSRCTNFGAPRSASGTNGTSAWGASEFWAGNFIYVPGIGDQQMLSRMPAYTQAPGPAASFPVVTTSFWSISCLPSLANDTSLEKTMGEGFLATSTDGTKYRFDWMVSYGASTLQKSDPGELGAALPADGESSSVEASSGDLTPEVVAQPTLARKEVWILPTLVTDRFGNWVRYTYDAAAPRNLVRIESSDGRAIDLSYFAGTGRVSSVSDGKRTWTYAYATGADQRDDLASVTLPDSSAWQFHGTEELDRRTGYGVLVSCDIPVPIDTTPRTGTMVHPTGATGTFTLKGTVHGRSGVPHDCDPASGYVQSIPRYYYTQALINKTISGPGLLATSWNYDYGAVNSSWAPCDPLSCITSKTVSVTDPAGEVTQYTFGTLYNVSDGRLEQVSESGGLRTTTTRYRPFGAGPYPASLGYNDYGGASGDSDMHTRLAPVDQRVTTQDGVTFTWEADTGSFDTSARPTQIARYSSLGMRRTEVTAYEDNLPAWVLGRIKKVTETSTGKVMILNSYDPMTLNLASESRFGIVSHTNTYNADGTLASRKDGLNHATTFTNYKRGIPQNISYPDASAESAVVDDIGLITSTTDAIGATTRYGYDAMGRINLVTYPAPDAVAWNATTISFYQSAGEAFGLAAGHWRQDVTTGNGRTSTYFDALWRPVYTSTYDMADSASSTQIVKRSYDFAGRTTFVSYPQRGEGDVGAGVHSDYDALGRPTASRIDSGPVVLTSSYTYGNGFRKTHTDARGNSSTSSYQAFDTPTEQAITAIVAPLDLRVAIERDIFGKTLSVTRSGGGASATRSYVYDANERLCKTVEPETGVTMVQYDGANNIAWRAPGLPLTSIPCDRASVTASAKISFGFDAMNRLSTTSYGEGAAGISRTYWPDGLPKTVVSGGATWTMDYNARRLPTTQVLGFGGQNYTLGTTYNANGHISELHYPTENNPIGVRSVAYAPDALGRPTRVGSFATGIGYHPGGAVAGFNYGNGKVHTMTQNARKLPEVASDAGIVQDRYRYDENGNVLSISDELPTSVSTRTLAYDALDRLKTAAAPGMWGNASYDYDVLDNIKSSTVGSRVSTYGYNAKNQLESLASTVPSAGFAYQYDARGNIIKRGTQAYVFDQGNRLTSAPSLDNYLYDGFGHRVQTSAVDGTVTVSVYSPAGQLLYTRRSGGPNPAAHTEYIYLNRHQIAEVKR